MTALDDERAAALGAFATGLRLEDVPGEVTDFARLLLLDTLGALLGGLRYPAVRRLARALPSGGSLPSGRLLTLGAAATWLDADSGGSAHPQGGRLPPVPTAHPAPHVLPVLLDAAARGPVGDRRLLEAFLAATEVGMRAGGASSLRPGLHPHGVHGPGSAALAAVLLDGGTAAEATSAFLLGSSQPVAATLAVPMGGGTVRNAWTGLGVCAGVLAARRAQQGVVVRPGTFSALFDGAVCTDLSPALLADDLGRRWEVVDSYLKPYACARWLHPALDAVRAALAGTGADAGDIAAVEVATFAFAASLSDAEVRSDMHARFSLPWCVATLLVDGGVDAASFLPEGLARPAVGELARRVAVTEEPAYSAALPDERPTRVTVRLRDGSVHTAEVRNARGNPADPLSGAEVAAKFARNVGDLVPAPLVERAVAALSRGPAAGDDDVLARLTRGVLADLEAG
ncbi:2-methylcitrate dehydratase PrpD [Geodermatophilus africanus]|uniref:2-methylcitrate dehydratase PrpD n=1 Tax=Geodermatophilus africanus TaxID=1137993 RepID=A0A1H3K3B0_9ACTN|nr:MmgE/PrpD family protein [Geodermatophilus africanus]SDY46641.1 2-methylcitrate dehydratase PrpD [Geodermatophilus africanus]